MELSAMDKLNPDIVVTVAIDMKQWQLEFVHHF